MRLFRLPKSFQRLRWKLTLSYTLVTLAVIGSLQAVILLGSFLGSPSSGWLRHYLDLATAQAAESHPFLEAALPDSSLLEIWLRAAFPNDQAVIVSPSGILLAASTQEAGGGMLPGQPFVDADAPDEGRQLIGDALGGKPVVLGFPDGTILTAAPILGEGKDVLGVLYVRGFSDTLIPGYSLVVPLAILASSLIGLTIVAGLIGTVFGRFASRGLVRRLEKLSSATEAWGRGQFSATVHDASADEIGELTRRMSLMAEQIQDLLQVRQDLATFEERNRLARDLHDSVKQQVFATTMMLGTADALWERDPQAAQQKVAEALALSRQAQRELAGLISEMRPIALAGRGLAAALAEHSQRWSRQTGIEVSVALYGEHPIPPEVEQALFRLAQEALTNVAKHSGAEHVEIKLVRSESAITLSVADDGRGFDPASAAGKGMGLRSMRERIEALGGELTLEGAPGAGTRLVARCGPVRA